MTSKQIPFFATQDDLAWLVRNVCSIRPLEFAIAGHSDKPVVPLLGTFANLDPFEMYLVFYRGMHVEPRLIRQHDGRRVYATDQLINPHTIVLHCGGTLHNQLIAGQIGTASNDKDSMDICKLFAEHIRKKFKKIKSYYVGPCAMAMFNSGARLSPTAKSPPLYDLAK